MPYAAKLNYMLTSLDGKIIEEGEIEDTTIGKNAMNFELSSTNSKIVIITFIFDDKFYVSQKVIKK